MSKNLLKLYFFRREYVFIILESNAKEDLKAKQKNRGLGVQRGNGMIIYTTAFNVIYTCKEHKTLHINMMQGHNCVYQI